MKIAIAEPNLKAKSLNERKVCYAKGYRNIEVESDEHFIELLNNYNCVFGELEDGYRSSKSLISHAPCVNLDVDDDYIEALRELLDASNWKYIIVPSASFDPISAPYKYHILVFTQENPSRFKVAYQYQVEALIRQLGANEEWFDTGALYDVARYFAPYKCKDGADADMALEFSEICGEDLAPLLDAPKEFENENIKSQSFKVQGKLSDECPLPFDKVGDCWMLPFNGYIWHTKNGWVRYTDVANELEDDNSVISGFACPACKAGHDSETGEIKDWKKQAYAFAFKSNKGGNLIFKCTGDHCKDGRIYVADGVYVGLNKVTGAIRRESPKCLDEEVDWESLSLGLDRVFYSHDKKEFYVKENGTFAKLDKSNISFWISTRHKFFDDAKFIADRRVGDTKTAKRESEKEAKNVVKAFYEIIIKQVQIIHQFDDHRVEVDVFGDAGLFLENRVLTLKYNTIFIKPPRERKPQNYLEIVNDYKNHFEDLDKTLDWIIACRFSKSRRRSFMYFRVNAGFGKSFFMGVLKNLGLGFETELEKLKPNSASDLSPMDFVNSIVCAIDEFTHFGKELKKMTHEISISPKFKLACRVPLFAKIFFSAEKSMSFFNELGVDEQLSDRTVVMDYADRGKLEARPVYQKSSADYVSGVGWYMYTRLKAKIDDYIAMGEVPASNMADSVLMDFKGNFEIRKHSLQDSLKEMVQLELYNLKSTYDVIKENSWNSLSIEMIKKLPIWQQNVLSMVGETATGDFVVSNASKVFELIVSSLDSQTVKTASYKKGEAIEMLGCYDQNHRRFTNGLSHPLLKRTYLCKFGSLPIIAEDAKKEYF